MCLLHISRRSGSIFSFPANPPAVLPKLINLIKEAWEERDGLGRHLIVKNLDFALLMVKITVEKELGGMKERVAKERFDFIYYQG